MKTNTKILLLSALTVAVLASLGSTAIRKVREDGEEESE